LRTVDANGGCPPVEGAHVDIWHCNAYETYSDEPSEETVGRTFLRGCQVTNPDGDVRFTTIFPGWYAGRAVHIHLKVRVLHNEHVTYDFTTQLFFDEGLIHEIHTSRSPYDARGKPQVGNADDYIYRVAGQELTVPVVTDSTGGYHGSIVIGLSDLPS
jgi:protocatechuate 3,4-dioxygenase beta subunit